MNIILVLIIVIGIPILLLFIQGKRDSNQEYKRPLPLSDQQTKITCPDNLKEIIVSIEPISHIFPLKTGETFTLIAKNVGSDFYWDIETLEDQNVVVYPEPGYDEVDVYLNQKLIGDSWEGVFDT
ncbi:hypothetical protein PQO03_02775 [Lentisphaera profundi]|uniref:EfeO-type cupredoxin-like domain-containing protein n=1 Tax=Lentisphaera profundi TaxID=1658616 RepID=A0ABY7VXT7_9BACT|nr:hypothetical protein [Lentisphaera profundi]WDE96322.1 hypothetical protein PQO03_11440 [Lentisphaera profundi]WDE96883.1 hypothetical protein PQO03_02775 [Lentisphaera profundi]